MSELIAEAEDESGLVEPTGEAVKIVLHLTPEQQEACGLAMYQDNHLMPPEDAIRFLLEPHMHWYLHLLVSKLRWKKQGLGKVVPEREDRYGRMRQPNVRRPVQGSWDCPTSPTKNCWYDHDEDECHDSCLFCRQPSERK